MHTKELSTRWPIPKDPQLTFSYIFPKFLEFKNVVEMKTRARINHGGTVDGWNPAPVDK